MGKKETLYIYTRVSTEAQVEKGYSLEAQKKLGIQKAKELKMDFKVYEEAGKSAAKEDLINRTVLTELIELIKLGEVKHLYATEWDRISRNEIIAAYIKKELIDNKVIVYTANGTYDLNDYNSDFIASIILLNAKRENKERVARSKRGRLEAAKQGKHSGGITAYGYTTDKENNLIIDADEKKIYLKMVSYSLKGMGAQSIAKKLNEESIPTKASKEYKKGIRLKNKHTGETTFKDKKLFIWKQGTIERILKNPLYKGERKYKDETIKAPAIIDAKTWQKIQDNFIKNKNLSGRNNKINFYLLKALVFCNRCGKVLIGRISEKKGMRIYFCLSKRSEEMPFCGMKSINIDKLNNLIWDKLLFVLTDSTLVRKELKKKFANTKKNINEINKETASLNRNLKEKEIEKTNLIRLATKNIINDTDLQKHLYELEEAKRIILDTIKLNEDKILLAQKEESTHEWIIKLEEKAKELYYLKDEVKKQEIIRSFINRITIDYLKEEKQHVIQLELKYPLYADKKTTHEYLIDGTDLTDKHPQGDEIKSLKERYEREAEENYYDSGIENNITELKKKALKIIKKKDTEKIHYDSAASDTV